jgi:hypothetical protein
MVGGPDVQVATSASETAPGEDAALFKLLDHIAVELAQEYVRLMEAAAEAAPTEPRAHSDTGAGLR